MFENLIEQQTLHSILLIELIRSSIGLLLLFSEIRKMFGTLKSKITLSMLMTVGFINLVFVLRGLGIMLDNENIRFFGAAISGLVAAISLIYWGSLILKFSVSQQRSMVGIMITGMALFVSGEITSNVSLGILGMIFISLTGIYIIVRMLTFVFKKSDYVMVRQRIFLIAMGWILFMSFEAVGIILMGTGSYLYSSIIFLVAFLGRVIMTLGVLLPIELQNMLKKVIK